MDEFILQLIARLDNSKIPDDIKTIEQNLAKKGINLKTVLDTTTSKKEIETLAKQLQSVMANIDPKFNNVSWKQWQSAINSVVNSTNRAKISTQEYVDTFKTVRLSNKIQSWLKNNTAATTEARNVMQSYIKELETGNITNTRFKEISLGYDNINTKMRLSGKLGLKWSDSIKKGIDSFSSWFGATAIFMKVVNTTKSAISTVKDLDTELVDLKKTTSATTEQLNDFYYESSNIAKQLGVTTKEIISQTSEWSRLGYAIEEAQTLAKNSAIFEAISPDMNIQEATDGLVSTLKAFKLEANDSLDGIISKVNIIGNTQAVSNGDIVDILTRSSSAMAAANNTLEQTIALGTAATEITRDADEVGTALKTISMRIRGYDEETESYSEDLENLSGKIADLTKTASTPGGISLFTDETKETYKSTYQIISDIRDIWDELSDKNQAQLLEALAGKRQGQIVSAMISNFSAAESSMESMNNSAGNAMKEMEVIYDSIDYKLNKLKETGTQISQDLFNREEMKNTLDGVIKLAEGVEFLTDKLGLLGTVGVIGGGILGAKNLGKCRISVRISNNLLNCFEYALLA